MSLENENQGSPNEGSHKLDMFVKKPKISYEREFLLSLSSLDICKKLPSGFDESLLCDFDGAVQSIQDRPRIPGTLPFQGFRRNDHGSSPPTREDSGNHSRGIYGKWENRSSERSDQESDSQSDRDSDSGRRYGYQPRRSWQTSEQDGLLGSGSFPRASGHATGISAPKLRANEHFQLSQSNEPYYPPRPYKAVPYSRRGTDSYNDETFGSMDCNNVDRAEEEKRRRASFEMMRKEQQRALQEKQKLDQEKHKSGDISDFREMLEGKNEEKGPFLRNHEVEVSAATPTLSSDLEKACRPPVPPGFKNNIPEKISGLKSPLPHPLLAERKPASRESLLDAEVDLVQNNIDYGSERRLSQEIGFAQPLENIPILAKGENVNLHISLDVPLRKPGMEDQLPLASSQLDSHGTLDEPGIVELKANVLEEKAVGDSTSILEKIFGSTLSIDDNGSSSAEHHDGKPDDVWSPNSVQSSKFANSVQSSKFAQWFFEEEAKPAEDISPARPKDLLSLIVSGDRGRYQVSDSEAAEHFPRDLSHNILEHSDQLILDLPPVANGVSDQACVNIKEETFPTVLTCEDLEQSILTEYSVSTTDIQPPLKGWSSTKASTEQPSEHVEDPASLHLLSLLQKGADQSNMTLKTSVDINLTDKPLISQEYDKDTAVNEPKGEENPNNILNSGKKLTLETLFGSAFMEELQSVEAPVSVQRGSTGSNEVDAPETHGLPFPITDNGISSAIDKIGLQKPSHDDRVLASNQRQQIELRKADNWLPFHDYQIGATSSKHYPKEVPSGFEGIVEFQRPEENINSLGDPRNHLMATLLLTSSSIDDVKFSSNASIDIMNKLAPISAVVKDERVIRGSESVPFTHGPFGNMEPELPYRSLQVQHPSPQFPPQMAQVRPLYNHLESHPSHMSSHMKFLGHEPTFNSDSPNNHQFPSSAIQHPLHHPNVGVARFDFPPHPSMLHQMKISGNHAPNMLPDFPRGGPVSHHGIHEMNQMQGIPLGARQPSISTHGLPITAPSINSGSNPPESLQRLIEMELRANSKNIQTFAPEHNQGIYGREVDMGFPYR